MLKILETLVIKRMFGFQQPLTLEYISSDELLVLETKLAGMTAAPNSVLARVAPTARNWRIIKWPGDVAPGTPNAIQNELLDKIAGDRRKVSKAAYLPKAKSYRDEHRKEARTHDARWKQDNPGKTKSQKERHRIRAKQEKRDGEMFARSRRLQHR